MAFVVKCRNLGKGKLRKFIELMKKQAVLMERTLQLMSIMWSC